MCATTTVDATPSSTATREVATERVPASRSAALRSDRQRVKAKEIDLLSLPAAMQIERAHVPQFSPGRPQAETGSKAPKRANKSGLAKILRSPGSGSVLTLCGKRDDKRRGWRRTFFCCFFTRHGLAGVRRSPRPETVVRSMSDPSSCRNRRWRDRQGAGELRGLGAPNGAAARPGEPVVAPRETFDAI